MDDEIRVWLTTRFVAINRKLMHQLDDEERMRLYKLKEAILIILDDIDPLQPEDK